MVVSIVCSLIQVDDHKCLQVRKASGALAEIHQRNFARVESTIRLSVSESAIWASLDSAAVVAVAPELQITCFEWHCHSSIQEHRNRFKVAEV
jgi:hypothetical protein